MDNTHGGGGAGTALPDNGAGAPEAVDDVLSAATAPATMDLPIGEVDRQQEPYQVV